MIHLVLAKKHHGESSHTHKVPDRLGWSPENCKEVWLEKSQKTPCISTIKEHDEQTKQFLTPLIKPEISPETGLALKRDLLILERTIQVCSHTQECWNVLWAELTLHNDVLVHRTQCRSGDYSPDYPLHEEKSWATYTQTTKGTDCHRHCKPNDQWLVASRPSRCTEWYVYVKPVQ